MIRNTGIMCSGTMCMCMEMQSGDCCVPCDVMLRM